MAHVKVKELVAAAYAAAPDLPPAAAQLMQDIAARQLVPDGTEIRGRLGCG